MKKILCLVLICMLLISVPVAAAQGPVLTANIEQAMIDAFWNSYLGSPLSAELKREIEENFQASTGGEIDISATEYYGNINGCEIILERVPPTDETCIELAGYTLYWSYCCNVYCYRNGEFKTIQDAYAQGWLTDEHVGAVAMLNGVFNAEDLRPRPWTAHSPGRWQNPVTCCNP